MVYQGLTPDQWEKAYQLAKKTGREMDEVIENIDFFSPSYDTVEEILKDLEETWLSWKKFEAMSVKDFLYTKLYNEEMNIKTGFHVKFNRKTYLCNLQELNKVFGDKKVVECKKWIYKDFDGSTKTAKNIFNIKLA